MINNNLLTSFIWKKVLLMYNIHKVVSDLSEFIENFRVKLL